MYQLGIYALGYEDVRHATILYPTVDPRATVEKIDIQDAVYRSYRGTITLRPVDFNELESLISLGSQGKRQRQAYARGLLEFLF